MTPRPSNRFLQRYLFYDDIVPYPLGFVPAQPTARKPEVDPNQLLVGQMLASGGIVVAATSHQMLKEQEKLNNRMSSSFMKQLGGKPQERVDLSPSKQKSSPQYH